MDNSCAKGSARRCSSAQFELRGLRRRKAERFETKNNKRALGDRFNPEKGTSIMVHSCPMRMVILATCLVLGFAIAAGGDQAQAENNLDASYTISFARVRVGDITASLVLGETEYKMSARGRAGGIIKVLLDGEGSFIAQGTIADGLLVPGSFASKIVSIGKTSEVTMALDGGIVKELAATPPPGTDRVPVTETNRQGVLDPLTALLFTASGVSEELSKEACRHTLPIFDGQQRYDLKLAFKRMDKATAEKGYAGPVVVCSLRYEPIAGHSASNTLVKYVSEGREMEIALAPIAGTRWLAPFRLSIGSTLANLVIEANRFEANARTEAPFTNPKAQ